MRPATRNFERRHRQSQTDKLDAGPDVWVARRAAEEWGVLSLDELRECGLSRDAVSVRVRNGRLHAVHRGVYAVGHANLPLEGRLLAAVKACGPRAVLSHLSAATVWGMVDPTGRYPEVTVVGKGTRTHDGLHVHRTCALDRSDIRRRNGIPVTSPARTVFDLAGELGDVSLRRVVRRAQSLKLVNISQLREVLARLSGRRGARRLTRIVATGSAPTRSELEDVVLDLVLGGGLMRPDVNQPLLIEGRRVIPDFRWPEQRLVVEADGAAWHDSKLAREDDAERQALLEAHGERVVRVTWTQAVAQPAQTLRRLRKAGAPAASGVKEPSSLSV